MKILSFGGGVDSSAILTMHLMEKDLGIEEVIFADTGAESKKTYENVEFFKGLCADAGLPFTIVAKDGENITEWVTRLGIVPVMPGGSHVCSKKYKGDVIQKWIDTKYPDQEITYLIGIELDEGHRTERFTKPKGDKNIYEYPLVEMGMTRQDCVDLLAKYGVEVAKSSCVFCPFMSPKEIKDIRNDPEAWETIKLVEKNFSEASPRKHQAWLDAGQPLNLRKAAEPTVTKDGLAVHKISWRAPDGMWKKDSWANGARLFTKKHNGKKMTVQEWEAAIDAGELDEAA